MAIYHLHINRVYIETNRHTVYKSYLNIASYYKYIQVIYEQDLNISMKILFASLSVKLATVLQGFQPVHEFCVVVKSAVQQSYFQTSH